MTRHLVDLLVDTLRLGEDTHHALAERWRGVDAAAIPRLMAHEGASIWLFRRLRATGALAELNAVVAEQLRNQAFTAAALRLEVEAEAVAVIDVLDAANIPVILIKGLARCALSGRYPWLDARATQDVDLLVPADRLGDADTALRQDGYRPVLAETETSAPSHHHLPPLHKGRITVEIHSSTSIRVPAALAWSRASHDSEVVSWSGRAVRVPCVTELAWSAIAHAMEDEARGFHLHRFLEVAALASGDAPIDWNCIHERIVTRVASEFFEVSWGVRDAPAVAFGWIGAALALVNPQHRPRGMVVPDFPLHELLRWRLGVLERRPHVGRQLSERLLAEGTRRLTGLPVERSPQGVSAAAKARRWMGGRLSRAAFHAWRSTR